MNETKFSGKGTVYAKNRPSYPHAFLDLLYTQVGMTADSIIADFGSGTGKLTRLLLERGSKVFAVEPNADMRGNAESELSCFDRFISVDCTAEHTTLETHSVDFVTVATAFHWFDRQAFRAECKRILKAGGKVIIVYNSRDEESDFVKKLYDVSRKYCPAFKSFVGSGTLLRPEKAGFYNDFFTDGYAVHIFHNDIVYDEEGFIGRCLSSSYALKEHDMHYSDYLSALRSLFRECSHDMKLVMPNITHCYIGTV